RTISKLPRIGAWLVKYVDALAEEGWRNSQQAGAPGWSVRHKVSADPTTPSAPGCARRILPSSARRGISHDNGNAYAQEHSRDVHQRRRTVRAPGKRQVALLCLWPPVCYF